ncbi:hypothetical protein SEA_MERCEDES_25 [Microbacterium phage Mercedes]|nr:hypothetical protein SEA_MERCEDES_25 [Microbacterium phage Mercedes]
MSNLDPHDYKNGQPITALKVGEEVSSASPKIELGKSKAFFAGAAGLVTALSVWLTGEPLADGAIDLNEGFALVLAVLGGLGVGGLGTYVVPTKVKGK